jgi:hypothetical protein
LLFFSCSPQVAGTGTDTSTKEYAKVQGTILDTNNTPSKNSIVYLVPADFNPVTDGLLAFQAIDTTDNNGNYQCSTKTSGLYNIIAVSKDLNEISFRKSLYIEEKKDTVLTTDTLKNGKPLKFFPLNKMINESGYIFLQGTPFYKKVTDRKVLLNNIPSQSPPLCYIENAQASKPLTICNTISTDSIDTANVFKILLIMESPSNPTNALILQHIRKLGGIPTTTDSASVKKLGDDDFNVVLIAPSADTAKADPLFADISVPIVNCNYWFYPRLGLTGPREGTDFALREKQEIINIYDTFQIARTIQGNIRVFNTPKTISFGVPGLDAHSVGTYTDLTTLKVLFCYDKGVHMVPENRIAPARRVAFFIERTGSYTELTDQGWLLLENSVLWSINR